MVPPTPVAPVVPKPPVGPIDPKSILLPKKKSDGPDKDSAQRINAGALLAQEAGATLPKAVPPMPDPTVLTKPKDLTPESSVKQLQTYKSDIESVVSNKNVSVVSIAAAEANRNSATATTQPATQNEPSSWRTTLIVAAGLLLLLAAVGIVAYVVERPTALPVAENPQAPFINTDDATAVVLPTDATRTSAQNALQAARENTKLAVGLIQWLYVARAVSTTSSASTQLSGADFLSLITPNVPPEFLRTVQGPYLLGVHSFDENQPFLILHVDSYGTAYAGMLDWERTMQGDLSPLFVRSASPHINGGATSAPTATTSQQFIPTSFVDKIVENRDTRAIVSPAGDLLLLWTFLDRNTIVITTNEYTLREVVSRINIAPVIPTPRQ